MRVVGVDGGMPGSRSSGPRQDSGPLDLSGRWAVARLIAQFAFVGVVPLEARGVQDSRRTYWSKVIAATITMP
jgi:hypothetical protein